MFLYESQINKLDDTSKQLSTSITATKKRCYTCKPRGIIKKHILGKSLCNNYLFHHDINKRPIILMTPVKHYTNIHEIPDLEGLFKTVRDFCAFWNIDDYQVSYNSGSYKKNDHFHIKIKFDEKIAERMRGDHFRRLKLEEQYK